MSAMKMRAVFLFAALVCNAASRQPSKALTTEMSPVRKVVTLLGEMKAQVEKEASDDEKAYNEYACWCNTNRKVKDEAVNAAGQKIAELSAFIEEAAGLEAQLKTEIAGLEDSIAEDMDSLATATALRKKENAAFTASSADQKECIAALKQALDVLAKVQLVQKQGDRAALKPLLLQLSDAVSGVNDRIGGYRSVMQQDLWDVMGSLGSAGANGDLSAIEERQSLRSRRQPNALEGAAAGSSSYNARSGSIYGILGGLKDEFERDLSAAQKQEMHALVEFQNLRASKMGEIAAATAQKKEKSATLADTLNKVAQAKEDLQSEQDALSADQKFLVGLEENCKTADEEYADRQKVRDQELQALSEAIKILTEDDARDLFGKTMSFLEVSHDRSIRRSVGAASEAEASAQSKAVNRAMRHILRVARQNKNWVLASLAVRVRLDSFTKVKEVMDKMLAELKEQQKAESEKLDFCKTEIDSTEDEIKVKQHEKEDLEGVKLGHENDIATLDADIETLKTGVADSEVSLKRAGEDRKAENQLFQQSVSDQRATLAILKKALARLSAFYKTKGALVQAKVHSQEPGVAVAPPPPKGVNYEKNAGSGGVLQLIDMIIADATEEEAKLVVSEQHAQKAYASFASDASQSIEADRATIAEKTKLLAQASAGKSEAEGSLITNADMLQELDMTLKNQHLNCDYLLKYYDVRQKARSEEMSAIAEAKAILSGADFGKVLEAEDDAGAA